MRRFSHSLCGAELNAWKDDSVALLGVIFPGQELGDINLLARRWQVGGVLEVQRPSCLVQEMQEENMIREQMHQAEKLQMADMAQQFNHPAAEPGVLAVMLR